MVYNTFMGNEVKIVTENHKATTRDYLSRVNDSTFPKWKAAELAKKYAFEYWDGDRRINYGGYNFKAGYWTPVAISLIKKYDLTNNSKVLDIGCGKGYLLYELTKILPKIEVCGVDISEYAVNNSHPEISSKLIVDSASNLKFSNDYFDLAISINTFHNLHAYDLENALIGISRVSKKQYLCVESYRNELEKCNLLYWQVTCEAFNTPEEWNWWFQKTNYDGDYEFIYFE